jgi:hypothetical protein
MMELEAVDQNGALVVRSGEARHAARFVEDVSAIFVGQMVRLQIEFAAPTRTRPGGELVEVAARIVELDTPDGATALPVAVVPGLVFRVEPLRTSLSASYEDGPVDVSSVPDAVDFDGYEGAGEPTGVVGNLKEMQLAEIVQTLAHAAKDAFVEVKPKDGAAGCIHVEHGQVVHAEVGAVHGVEAFFALLPADRGLFRIRYGQKGPERTIQGDTTFLLLEAARRVDEREQGPPAPLPIDPFSQPPGVADPYGAPQPVSAGLVESETIESAAADLLNELDRLARDVAFAASASVDEPAFVRSHPATSPFRRFFDEAGIEPSPASFEGGGGFFTSLRVDVHDDPAAQDSQATARVRRRGAQRTDPPGP